MIVTPALAAIPLEVGSWFRPKALSKTGHRHQLALTLTKRPHCSLSEAFRVLGTAVSGTSNPPTTLLITSAQTGEGKTFTALNLAQALAQRTGPILIMDCDLRRSGIAEALGIRNDKGVSTVLSGEHDVSEVVQQYVPVPNLWVLPSGIIPSNPAELLASPRMTALLETLSAQFVCVIIDSPPVLAVTDATILSTLVDGVLLVAASGSTPRGAGSYAQDPGQRRSPHHGDRGEQARSGSSRTRRPRLPLCCPQITWIYLCRYRRCQLLCRLCLQASAPRAVH